MIPTTNGNARLKKKKQMSLSKNRAAFNNSIDNPTQKIDSTISRNTSEMTRVPSLGKEWFNGIPISSK